MGRALRYCGLTLLLLIIVAGPFCRGLFYPYLYLWAVAGIGLGFALWALGRRQPVPLLADPTERTALAILAAYLLASFTAVFPQGHLNLVLQHGAALMVFYVLREEQRQHPALGTWLSWLLVLAAAGLALVGLAPYAGLQPLITGEAAQVLGVGRRLSSTLEYWNTYAAYIMAMWLLLTGLAVSARRQAVVVTAAGALGFLFGVTFLLAASRGALLVLPVAALLLALALPPGRRVTGLLFLGITLAGAVAAHKGVDSHALQSEWTAAVRWLLAGAGGTVAGTAALAGWLRLRPRWQAVLAGALLAGVLAGGGLVVRQHGSLAAAAQSVLSAKTDRLLDMSLRTPNVVLRLDYDRDALRILRDRPLLGAGGRSWERLYPQYQDYRYEASEVHNHYLHVAVEAGLAGLLAYTAFFATLAWRLLRRPTGAAAAPLLAAAVLTIAVHAVVDFNYSYFAVVLFTFAGAGVAAGSGRTALRRPRPGRAWALAPLGALTLALALPQAAASYLVQDYLDRPDRDQVPIARLEQAALLLPLDPTPRFLLAWRQPGTAAERTHLQAARRLDPLNYQWANELYAVLRRHRDWPAAYEAAKDAVRLQPAWAQHYYSALEANIHLATEAVLQNRREEALQLIAEGAALVDRLEQQQRRAEPKQHLWRRAYPAYTRPLHLRAGQALALSGQYARALPHLSEAARDWTLNAEAEIWQYLTYEQQHDRTAQLPLEQRIWFRFFDNHPLKPLFDKATALRG